MSRWWERTVAGWWPRFFRSLKMPRGISRQYRADVSAVADESAARIFIRACNEGQDVWLNFHVTTSSYDDFKLTTSSRHESVSFKQKMRRHRQGRIANTN